MNYNVVKERLGVLPLYLLHPSHDAHSHNDLSSPVTQSFVDEFDAQTLSVSLSPLPSDTYYSPRASIDSVIPSPIIFDSSNASHSPSSSSEQSDESHPTNSSADGRSLSSSLPLLSGIEPLHSEETVGLNVSLLAMRRKHRKPQKITRILPNQDNSKITPKTRLSRPLSSLTNLLCPSSSSSVRHSSAQVEKRTLSEHYLIKTKRHRSTTNLS